MDVKWEPAVYEHKAALIGKTPSETANSAELLARAVLREYEVYKADYITVGLDIYNIEAEALGAKLTVPEKNACPDVAAPLFDLNNLPGSFQSPDTERAGRFGLLREAGETVRDAIGHMTKVRVALSGPVTAAAKLTVLDDLIMSLALEDGNAARLLEFTCETAEAAALTMRRAGLDVIFFDSMAAPPILSPDMYSRFALPLHSRLMRLLEREGQGERELVVGGNTVPVAGALAGSGANILLCDFAADAAAFKSAIGDSSKLKIRRNIKPSELMSAGTAEAARKFRAELGLFENPIAGTGILPYDFNPEKLLDFKRKLDA
jgi:uroporphyrinogen decarboxylase